MRIGFDATAIPENRAGAGVYIFQLARALAQIDRKNDYFLFGKPDHLREMNIDQANFHLIDCKLKSTWHRVLWEQTILPTQVKKLRIDVLHSPHYTMPLRKPCRHVVTFCDMIFFLNPEVHSRGRRIFFQTIMRWSARHADRLISISESTRADASHVLQITLERIICVPLAASSAFRRVSKETIECVCARYNLKPDRFLLFVGVLEPRKNVPTLLKAYAHVVGDFPEVPLVIAGKKGWMYDAIFQQVTELGLQEQVRFPGYVPEEDLIALYNGARAFIYPSLYEGFGLPVLEALQCGTPVITSNISSMPEVAQDAALLITPTDVVELATALQRLLTEDDLARELTRKGLERANQFSWERCARETLQVYRSVANH